MRMLARIARIAVMAACWMVVMIAASSRADNIPISTVPLHTQYPGVGCDGSFPSGNYMCYSINPHTELESFILEDLADPNRSLVIPGKYARLDATVNSFTFNQGTGQASGSWTGVMWLLGKGADDHTLYQYDVSGTVNVAWPGPGFDGLAGVRITQAVLTGRIAETPEPETWVLGITGLMGIAGAWWRRIR